jgi:hypothetical protein
MTTQPDFRALCAELVKALDQSSNAVDLISDCLNPKDFSSQVAEAIELIRQSDALIVEAHATLNAPPIAPIPVSERLPGPEALKGGYCWFWLPEDEVWFWERPDSQFITDYGEDGSWLPHWAIPLPEEPE